jgi:translocation and assembly module TamB
MDFRTNILGEKVTVDGEARLTRGTFELFANTFTVEDAGAMFKPRTGLDPHIRLSSSTVLDDAKVFLGIEGTVSNPRLRLYSEPSLPQEAIFALLISGSSEESVSGSSMIANVLQMRYPVFNRVLHDKMGFDRVAIGGSASGTGTVVKLGKRLTDKLFIYTSFNLHAEDDENDYAVNFEYDIVDRVTLDTMAGNEVSSVDVGWQVPLGTKKSKKKRGGKPASKPEPD